MSSTRFEGDPIHYQGQRRKLVEGIENKGITDPRILEAMQTIPRHLFMDSSFVRFAYKDQAFPIGAGQTISQPYTVAYQTDLLELGDYQKILEVGTGSGYQTAILCEMGMRVFTIERIKSLHDSAQGLLSQLDYPAQHFYGDGYKGLPSYGPFDRILVTAGAPGIPENLKDQLTIGGIMIVPVGEATRQTMLRCQRISETEYRITEHGYFVFVPMLKGKKDE